MKGRILVTPRSVTRHGHQSLELLRGAGYEPVFCTPGAQPTEDELVRLVSGCIGYLAGVEKVTARVLAAADALRVISRNGTGVDNIDLAAAQKHNIRICRAAGANARGVAELALGLTLSLARSIPFSDRSIKAGGWDRRTGTELEGLTLGIVGCGRIGRMLAKFALGMDMRVLAYDVMPDVSLQPSAQFQWASLDDLLAQADVISLHCPAAAGGRAVIDAAAIAKMKKGVMIVNTARHELIDQAALLEAIEHRHVAGVALDVFETEPPAASDSLAGNDRVIATPHIGGLTAQSVDRAMFAAVQNLLEALRCDG
jgi:D-3-phosphoglycerate dehydrogenase / 2-oxoglutarate reductase